MRTMRTVRCQQYAYSSKTEYKYITYKTACTWCACGAVGDFGERGNGFCPFSARTYWHSFRTLFRSSHANARRTHAANVGIIIVVIIVIPSLCRWIKQNHLQGVYYGSTTVTREHRESISKIALYFATFRVLTKCTLEWPVRNWSEWSLNSTRIYFMFQNNLCF